MAEQNKKIWVSLLTISTSSREFIILLVWQLISSSWKTNRIWGMGNNEDRRKKEWARETFCAILEVVVEESRQLVMDDLSCTVKVLTDPGWCSLNSSPVAPADRTITNTGTIKFRIHYLYRIRIEYTSNNVVIKEINMRLIFWVIIRLWVMWSEYGRLLHIV